MLQRHGVTQAAGQPKKCRIARKHKVVVSHSASPVDAEAYVSASQGMASGSSADAEAYGPTVDIDTFVKAWQMECPWLVIRDDASKADADAYVHHRKLWPVSARPMQRPMSQHCQAVIQPTC